MVDAVLVGRLLLIPLLSTSAPDAPSLGEAELLAELRERSAAGRVLELEAELALASSRQAALREGPSLGWEHESPGGSAAAAEDRLELGIPLPTGGAAAERGLARAAAGWTRVERELAREALLREGLARYHRAVVAAARAAILREAVAGLAEARRVVAAREAAGQSSGYERSRLAIEEELLRSQLRLAEGEAEAARHRLAVLLARPADSLALPSGLDIALPAPTAWSGHPALDLAREAVDAARPGWALAASWIPAAELRAGRLWVEGEDEAGFTAGASLSLPLFDRGQARRAQLRAQERLAGARLESLERELHARWEAARARLEHAQAARQRIDDELPATIALLTGAARSGYVEGRLGILEWLDARGLARRAALERLELEHACAAAAADLREAGGNLR